MYHNVSFDITTFEGDAIVNSLGIGPRIDVPGRIYRSILNAAKDPLALKSEVTKQGKELPFTSTYLTDSFGLPCKKIIHAITPFRRIDRKNEQIEQTYQNILKLALDSGLKSICVPLIGTGANGYSSDKVAQIARRACYRFAEEHPDFEVYLNIYSVEVAASRDEEEEDIYPDEPPTSYSRPKQGSRRRRNIDAECEGPLWDEVNPGCAGGPSDFEIDGIAGAPFEDEGGDGYMPSITVNRKDGYFTGSLPKPKKEPAVPFLERIGLKYGDSFATLVRKFVFTRTRGSKAAKEAKLEDMWLDINSLVAELKLSDTALAVTASIMHDVKEKGEKTPANLLKEKSSHSAQYEWKKVKNPKSKGYVWQRPNKAEILLSGIAMHLKPEEVMELFEFCGFALSKYEMYDNAFRECVPLIHKKDPWTQVVQTYRFYTSESIYDYKEDRRKIYTDTGEYW